MKVAILFEFSGVVRDAFKNMGHEAISCDLLPTEKPGSHWQGDCKDFDWKGFDLAICHPPCTRLCNSGARWNNSKRDEQKQAIELFMWCVNLPVPRIAIENPVGIMSTVWRKPDQIIQPWQFGHPETKATCLWLKNLPLLVPTNIVDGRIPRVHFEAPSPERWKNRSRTLPGIATAFASQWL